MLLSATSEASASPIFLHGSIPGCSVEVTISGSSASATLTGCKGGDFWMSSWAAQSDVYATSGPQTLIQSTNSAPWVVALPVTGACYFQLDFSQRNTPPGSIATQRTPIIGYLGQTPACTPVTTTTIQNVVLPTTTTTTTVPGATTTTIPNNGTTGSTTTTIPMSVTTAPGPSTTTGTTLPSQNSDGGTTTTTPAGTPPSKGGSGNPPGSANSVPAGKATPASGGGNTLAFTGFAILMLVFFGITLIAGGSAIVRASRGGHTFTWASADPDE